jgi:hypothetical protein
VRVFSREAAEADSRGLELTGIRPSTGSLSREAATATGATNCCRRFAALEFIKAYFLRADARSYLLPPLRG